MPNLEVLELQGGKDPNHLFGNQVMFQGKVGKLGRLKFEKNTSSSSNSGFDERRLISTVLKV